MSTTGDTTAVRTAAGSSQATRRSQAAPAAARPAPRAGRRVKLMVSRVDPFSVMKVGFLVSVAMGIAMVVMTGVMWALLSAMGTIDRVIEHLPTSPTDHQLLAQRQPHSPEIRLGALVTESRPGESRAEAVLYALFRGVGWVLGGVLSRGIGGGGRY